jgi:hypothetical protein
MPIFWDVMITLFLLACAGMTLWTGMRISEGGIGNTVLCAVAAIGFVLIAYGSFLEPRRIVLRYVPLRLPLKTTLRVILAADFHVGPYKGAAYMKRIVDHIIALQPDIIFLPGDFPYDHLSDISSLSELSRLHPPLGMYAVMGNHDTGRSLDFFTRESFTTVNRSSEIGAFLENQGITVLHNESRILKLADGSSLAIAGVDEVWGEEADLEKTFSKIPEGMPTILLSHHPDVILEHASHRADLILCGHTHGGQIRLPIIGPLSPIPSKLGRKYDRGFFSVGDRTTLFITCGLGETMARARLFCPPEIVVMEGKE